MKTFYCLFSGVYPVGACAIIVAQDEQQAELDMRDALGRDGFDRYQDLDFVEIYTTEPQVIVLLNGDY